MKVGAEVTFRSNIPALMRKVDSTSKGRMLESVIAVRNTVLETLAGSRRGRTYRVPGTRRTYTASAPGQPPAVATAELRQSIKGTVKGEGKEMVGTVGTDKIQGLMTEFGTRNMAARPWLRVSLEKTQSKLKGIWGRKWF